MNLSDIPNNLEITNSFLVTNSKIGRYDEDKICVSISGGADSDIMLDLICKFTNKIKVVWFDTGLEYQATKEHLDYLENKYDIKIEKCKAIKPIPITCKEYGQPFVSKQVSNNIARLQRHNFAWEDEDFDTLLKKYPKCKSALKWWCNHHGGYVRYW